MRTIGVALVVVLMVLRTAARSGRGSDDFIRHEETTTPFPTTPPSTRTTTTDSTTIPTPAPTPTSEFPTEDCSALGCRTVPGSDGFDTCDCSTYNCDNVTCGPDQECVMQDVVQCDYPWCPPEPNCVPKLFEPPMETTIRTPHPLVCPTISCGGPYCSSDYSAGGCPTCFCWDPICGFVLHCGPDEECLPSVDDPLGFACVSIYGTTTETNTGPTIGTHPPPVCPDVSGCDVSGYCYLSYMSTSDGCPTCICWVPTPFPTPTTTTDSKTIRTPTPTTAIECPDMSSCTESSYCYLDYTYLTDGCPTCICSVKTTTPTPTPTTPEIPTEDCFALGCRTVPGSDTCDCSTYNCDTMTCDPDQYCVMQNVADCYYPWCPTEPTCIPYVSTTPTTTPTVTTTDLCPMVTCIQGCRVATDYKGCTYCDCVSTCEGVTCPSGEQCEMLTTCDPSASSCSACVPIPVTTAPCSTVECDPDCVSDTGSDGCPTCKCPPNCKNVTCDPGYVCEMGKALCFTTPCYREPKCVAVQTTTTTCPMIKCAPECVPGEGSDGCSTCDCPPSCQTVKCSAGHECQLVNVTCKKDPCYPQPQCVPTENPCTGTPNTRRCGRFRNRWTYNSVTDKCEKFRHYGCTPSLNTFLSPKACKNKCQGSAQSICEDVVCEKNCYTYTRKNKCSKCICPNPCKGFKCREGYECKMRESKCESKDPKPFCARKS